MPLPPRPRRVLLLGLLLLGWSLPSGAQEDDMAQAIDHARSLSRAFRQAAETATPSVVTVLAKTRPRTPRDRQAMRELLQDPRFRRLFPDGELPFEVPEGDEDNGETPLPALTSQVGSGVVIDAEGVILTNNHVVQDADEIVVRLPDGRELNVMDTKTDPLSDLAVLRIRPERELRPARLGDSAELSIGDWVIAIGSPFELEATVSAGIISGKGRGIEKIRRGRLLQTDAAINPGNSGGPLVDLDGQVVGINTAIASSSGGYQGIGFAIPINRAKWVSQELLTHGRVRRAFLGIRIDELTPKAAEQLQLAARSGVFVREVINEGPADQAGLRTNDVIVEFAGERVRGPRDLQDVVEQKPIDTPLACRIMRGGKPIELTVTLREMPDE